MLLCVYMYYNYTHMQDKDGRISLQDFLDGAKADSTIVKALTIYDSLLWSNQILYSWITTPLHIIETY